jgi:cbb3-type cytochrome oxidase subunit 3
MPALPRGTSSLTFFLIFIVATIAVIWWLYRNGRQRRLIDADRNAPLPSVDPRSLTLEERWKRSPGSDVSPAPRQQPEFALAEKEPVSQPIATPAASVAVIKAAEAPLPFSPATPTLGNEHWQEQLRTLRDAGALDAALTLARAHFPRLHALQQAAVILRQQVRHGIDRQQNVDYLLGELYDTALFAALPRGKTTPKLDTLGASSEQRYRVLGYQHLKLLNKNDIRYLRQLWGEPERHQHIALPSSHF